MNNRETKMLSELLSEDELTKIREAIYVGDGYYVLRKFIRPEHARYILDHWRFNNNPVIIKSRFNKSKFFFENCQNYSHSTIGKKVHFNFFWNIPSDPLTYNVAWKVQRIRNQIEGNPASDNYLPLSNSNMPISNNSNDRASAASFRVVGTAFGGAIEAHRDWEHDPSKIQMSLTLSTMGTDYDEGGFTFRKRDGSFVNLSSEAKLEPGDLLIFRYCMDHGVATVHTSNTQIGFWRILFPIEPIRTMRFKNHTRRYTKSWILQMLIRKLFRKIKQKSHSLKNVNPPFSDSLESMAEIAIQSGISPSEVFYKKGLFARWDVMQRWQFEALLAIGLQPENRFLDIGCGVLRLGMVLIPYLNSNRYFGTDAVPAYIEASQRFATCLLKTSKQYQILLDRSFEFTKFGVKFDFAMAHSVFTHMSKNEITDCMRNLSNVMAPGGKFLFTIALNSSLREDYEEAFVYNATIPMVRSYHSTDEFYKKLSFEIGFNLEQIYSPKHPSQSIFIATFNDSPG